MAAAVARVTAARVKSVSRQPKASTVQASGREPAMLPMPPMPITAPANVPKTAGE